MRIRIRVLALSAVLLGSTLPIANAAQQSPQPARAGSAASAAPTAILRQLHVTTTEDVASDEPYLRVNGKTVWGPRSVDEGDNRTIGVVAHAGDKVRLYEQDGDVPFDDDDFLGEATIKGVSGTLRFSRDDARYSLSYGPRPSTADYILNAARRGAPRSNDSTTG